MDSLTLSGPLSSKLLLFLGGGLQWQQLRKHLMPPTPFQLCLSHSLAVGQWQHQNSRTNQALSWKTVVNFLSATCSLTPNQGDATTRWYLWHGPPSGKGRFLWPGRVSNVSQTPQTTNQTRETRNKSWRVSQSSMTVQQSPHSTKEEFKEGPKVIWFNWCLNNF